MAIHDSIGFAILVETDGDVLAQIFAITDLFDFAILSSVTDGTNGCLYIDAGVKLGAAVSCATQAVLQRSSGPLHFVERVYGGGWGSGPAGRIIAGIGDLGHNYSF